MRIIYIFIDGIGLGKNEPDSNPFTRYSESFFSSLGGKQPVKAVPDTWKMKVTDCTLGCPGLPQSATGQTSLWTGINGANAMGRHMTGFPGPTLAKIIKEFSMIKKICESGRKATLLNAYSKMYLERIEKKPRLASASTHVQRASGQPLKTLEDLENNQAMYMDITHEFMHAFFPNLSSRFPIMDPVKRGEDIVKMSRSYDLVIYEYFLSDKAGHNQSWEQSQKIIETLEKFLSGIVSEMNTEEELLLITSDHGNLEDLSTKTHTLNPVPTFGYGLRSDECLKDINRLTDIPVSIYKMLGMEIDLSYGTG